MSGNDPYRDWDGAYVLGSLSPDEHAEYERHLATCDTCSRDVAELGDLGGILSTVPADRAMTLLDADPARASDSDALRRLPPVNPEPALARGRGRSAESKAADEVSTNQVPPTLLPPVIELAGSEQARRRRRRGALTAAVVAVAACIALAAALVVPRVISDGSQSAPIVLAQTVSSPITAEARLIKEPFGTTIEVTCWYSEDWSPPPGITAGATLPYDLYITDTDGMSTKQASWTASPGMIATPTATTQTPADQIASVDIRVGGSDVVLLEADL